MILRNPALWRDSLFVFLLPFFLFLICLSTSMQGQGLAGTVRDAVTLKPISQIPVSLFNDDSLITQVTTDILGQFSLSTNEAMRVHAEIQFLGYKAYTSQPVTLDGYSTFRVDYELELFPFELEPVNVNCSIVLPNPHLQQVGKEDLLRVAGNFDDPIRVAQSFPGIVVLNDQTNFISARGQSPVFNGWYLEGLEIVNPNHTSNAGTLSDTPTSYGGGVNLFSAQSLGTTDIYTGLNPLNKSRISGAVIDMHLHESAEPEFRVKAGLLGFEVGAGQTVGKDGVFDVNLRYSFTGLLTELGADFGGEKIGFYDGVVSYLQKGKDYSVKIFAWGGNSSNEFNHLDPSEQHKGYKDFFDIDYQNKVLGSGLRFQYYFNDHASLRTGIAYSTINADYSRLGHFGSTPVNYITFNNTKLLFATAEFSYQTNRGKLLAIGMDHTFRDIRHTPNLPHPIEDQNSYRPYVNGKWEIFHRLRLELGGEILADFNIGVNAVLWPGYRAILDTYTRSGMIFYAGMRHARNQNFQAPYDNEEPYQLQPTLDKYEAGWRYELPYHVFQIKAYYQSAKDLPVYQYDIGFLSLADYSDPIGGVLQFENYHTSDARYYGLEGQWNFRLRSKFNVSLNQTLFRSLRNIDGGDFASSRYDNQFVSHVLLSKEIINQWKKEKNRIWNFSLRGILQGGIREPNIDLEASRIAESTIFVDPAQPSNQLDVFKRIDAGFYRTIANKKIRWRYALDIQNVLGFSNAAYHYYDPFLDQVKLQEQLGLIPVLSVQASW